MKSTINIFEKHVDHRGLYERCVLPEFRDIFPYSIFRNNLEFIIKNTPKNLLGRCKMKAMLLDRYVNEYTVRECYTCNGVGRGYFYYWTDKGIKALSRHITSIILQSPMAIVLLEYISKNGANSYITELYKVITQKKIGVAEFIFSKYGNSNDGSGDMIYEGINVKYNDSAIIPNYTNLVKYINKNAEPNFLRDEEFDKFFEYLKKYLYKGTPVWLCSIISLFENNKPFYSEFISLYTSKSI